MTAEELAQVMARMRPRLHRYCARMVGSAFDGEDVVQDALAKAMEALPMAGEIGNPEGWLLRIAHNTALDALRRRKRQGTHQSDEALAMVADETTEADRRVVAAASLASFLHLPPIQRSTVVLSDVLGHSDAETAEILGVTLPTVKAALHRGRQKLRRLVGAEETAALPHLDRERLRAYVDRFNARDFDALRALLSEDVRLDLVNRTRIAGKKDVSVYFTRYAENRQCRIWPGLAEDRGVLLVSDPAVAAAPVAYVILLDWSGESIVAIRDFRYAPYVMESLDIRQL